MDQNRIKKTTTGPSVNPARKNAPMRFFDRTATGRVA
jgi:hypothetical protein